MPSKNIWLPAIIQEVNKKENGLSFAQYKVSFELKDEDKKEEEENKQNEENKNIDNDKEPDPRINLLRLIISLFGRLYF